RRSQILADYARENVMLVSPDSVGILHADGSGRVRNIARISLEKTDGFGTRAGQSYWRSAFQIGPKPVFAISQYGRMGAVGDSTGKIVLFTMEDGSVIWERK